MGCRGLNGSRLVAKEDCKARLSAPSPLHDHSGSGIKTNLIIEEWQSGLNSGVMTEHFPCPHRARPGQPAFPGGGQGETEGSQRT